MTLNQLQDGQYAQDTRQGTIYRRIKHQIERQNSYSKRWIEYPILFSEACEIAIEILPTPTIVENVVYAPY